MNEVEKNILNSLGSKLRSYRLQKNFSQEKFAELTELDRTYISGLERGKRNPSYLIIKRLCEILEITPNNLFITEGD
ncbi:MAG: helix-turn-helix transcriptional regulator [Treponema sp.]|nr:helix-turn-helix transcriptional regulator [Treponema sp.]MEE3435863.1 helix-turn-helix transcriptional regulator [Treponema sp.]